MAVATAWHTRFQHIEQRLLNHEASMLAELSLACDSNLEKELATLRGAERIDEECRG